jgi:hypothetical protein
VFPSDHGAGAIPKQSHQLGNQWSSNIGSRSAALARMMARSRYRAASSASACCRARTAALTLAGRRARRERPRRRCAAEKGDELAAFHVWMAPAWQETM